MLRAPWYFVEQNVIWFIQITWIGRSFRNIVRMKPHEQLWHHSSTELLGFAGDKPRVV